MDRDQAKKYPTYTVCTEYAVDTSNVLLAKHLGIKTCNKTFAGTVYSTPIYALIQEYTLILDFKEKPRSTLMQDTDTSRGYAGER